MPRTTHTPAQQRLRLTAADLRTERSYESAQPKRLGTLHERMQYVMHVAEGVLDDPLLDGDELMEALRALELEVALTKPAKPPMAQRLVPQEGQR